ncbi:MAG TPA: UDP-N-acetylglucosamine--N-acetylmuramyl-(pentapeptide) pyrophosphoryl-undecaprenol N-acetylglucosamine transferase, partial [Candidatus Limnocylindria bacterium]|nr:UDP-N-acetylglucosamine--N-acetylmuramyl-(pentapeptide) pyrophosphoryl-undecaprenol N-acetylglucosamine transferase [Candidatus Limnocylindria bacterium]
MNPPLSSPSIAIACGGTGGHLFPGLAVGRALGRLGCRVSLFVSSKGIDQTAVANIADLAVVTLPAVAQQDRNYITFARSMARAWSGSKAEFRRNRPDAVLAMGGFTSCPVVFAGASTGALTFLHESNTIPGRANRLLAHWVDECFVGFPEAAGRLWNPRVTWTGTPSRDGFVVPTSAQVEASRIRLGLDPQRPVLLVTGGSQGARGLNKLFLGALPQLVATMPSLQYIHLTGEADLAMAEEAHAKL